MPLREAVRPRRHHAAWPEGGRSRGRYVGRDAVMRQLEQQRETWDSDSFELISDFIDVGDRVAVRFIWHGRGLRS